MPVNLENLKYPIGKFVVPNQITKAHVREWIHIIEAFPESLQNTVVNLEENQLKLIYRPEGWTIQQVVHHCADSHMNSFIRFKLALTEDKPIIRPYFEDRWAVLPDVLNVDLSTSIEILYGLHHRWVVLLKSLDEKDLNKEFVHPEHGATTSLKENIGIYAWHCQHHLAHIKQAIKYQGKFD